MKNEICIPSFGTAKPDKVLIIEYIIRFSLSITLSQAQLFGQINPLAVALMAAGGASPAGIVSLLGAVIGYLLSFDYIYTIKYLAITVLTFFALFVFRETSISKKVWFAPLAAGVITACIGFVYAADSGFSLSAITLYAAEITICSSAVYFYKSALSPWGSTVRNDDFKHAVSLLILICSALIALAPLKFFGEVSIGRIAAVLLVMLTAFKGGIAIGCPSAVAIGAAIDCAGGFLPFFTMAYGFSALISGIFSKRGQLFFCLSFILANALIVLFTWGYIGEISIMYEVFCASVLFIIIPTSLMNKISSFFPGKISGYGALKARDHTRRRVEMTADAFRTLQKTVETAAGDDRNDSDPATIFDRAADSVCLKCKYSSRCWQREYEKTLTVLNDLTPKLLTQGSLCDEDFPSYFADECPNLDSFISAINDETRSLLYRRQYKRRLMENCGTAYKQYSDMSAVLDELSFELGNAITFEPDLERKLCKYLKGLNIEASAAVFRDRGGRLHVELFSGNLYRLKRDKKYLDKLSALLDTRLCTSLSQSGGNKIILMEAEPLAASIGIASAKKSGQSVSGDRGTYFKTDEGILYVLLSDGMGSGACAAKCSADVSEILENFLKAGVSAETSLSLLDDLMLIRNELDTTSATIDLMALNLFTGETRLFKYGAAPSYIKHGGRVNKITCQSFAPGFSPGGSASPDFTKLKLEPSSIAVIISDGVTGGEDDGWLTEMLSDYQGDNARELSRMILDTATQKFNTEDDMTVLTVFTEKRA